MNEMSQVEENTVVLDNPKPITPEEQKVLEWTLINPRPEAVFDLAEELHCETASVYRIRARAVNKLVRLRYGAGE